MKRVVVKSQNLSDFESQLNKYPNYKLVTSYQAISNKHDVYDPPSSASYSNEADGRKFRDRKDTPVEVFVAILEGNE